MISFPLLLTPSRSRRYQALDQDGICMVGELLENGGIMVNKESPVSVAELDGGVGGVSQYKPSPLSYKAPAPAYVDKVLITSNESEHFLVKVGR